MAGTLVHQYLLENNVVDNVGSANGTPTSATYVLDGIRPSYCLNGGYFAIAGIDSIFSSATAQFSISTWLKMSSFPNYGQFVSTNTPNIGIEYDVGKLAEEISVKLTDSSNVQSSWVVAGIGNNLLPFDVWINIILTYDYSLAMNDRVKIYVNGVNKVLTPTIGSTIDNIQASTAFYVNSNVNIPATKRPVDDFRIYTGILSAAQILEINPVFPAYANPVYPSTPILSRWLFENNLIDSNGSNNGTLIAGGYSSVIYKQGSYSLTTESKVDFSSIDSIIASATAKFSISCLAYSITIPGTLGDSNALFYTGDNVNVDYGIAFTINCWREPIIVIKYANLDVVVYVFDKIIVPRNEWVSYLVKYDYSSVVNRVRLQINGVWQDAPTLIGSTTDTQIYSINKFSVGYNPVNETFYLDDMRVYNEFVAPNVSLVDPSIGIQFGQLLTITGTDFDGIVTTVSIGGVDYPTTSISQTEILMYAPAIANVTYDLIVNVDGLNSNSYPISFSAPGVFIDSINPYYGIKNQDKIIINGTGFIGIDPAILKIDGVDYSLDIDYIDYYFINLITPELNPGQHVLTIEVDGLVSDAFYIYYANNNVFSFIEYPINPKLLDNDFVFMFWYANDDLKYGQVFSLADGAIKMFKNSTFEDVFNNHYTFYINEFFASFTSEDSIDKWQHFCIKNDTTLNEVSFYFNGVLIKTMSGILPPATLTNLTIGQTKTIDLFDIRLYSGVDSLVIDEDILAYYVNDIKNNSGNKILPYA
jgi:hypothetical protein